MRSTSASTRRHALAAMAALAGLGWAGGARAADFPSRPIRLVVPFAAGGLTDAIARSVAEALRGELDRPVVVENKPGASGHLGADAVAKAPPDGHTVVLLSTLHAAGRVYNADVVRYDLFADFVALGLLGASPSMIVVRKDLGVQTVPQFVALAKARPGRISFAAVSSYLGEFFEAVADVDLNVVLYRGAAAAANDLLGDNVDAMTGTASDMSALLRSGRFVAIGVSGSAPVAEAPDARPIVESLPAYRGGQAYGLFAPARLPAPALALWRAALAKAVQSPSYRSRLAALSMTPPDRDADASMQDLKAATEAYALARARAAQRRPGG